MSMKSKKDLDWIAGLEKAIKKKYGEEAIQNPKSEWNEEKEKEYLEQLKKISVREDNKKDKAEKVDKDGFLVSKKLLRKDSNRTCPVCNQYSFDKKDDLYMIKYECCWSCYIQYIDGREARWKKGWRPNNENDKNET